jgi:alpha-beta hydrolase superfamily lysophospholipase
MVRCLAISQKQDSILNTRMVKHIVFGVERDIDISKENWPTPAEIAKMEEGFQGCEHGWFDSVYQGAKLHYRKVHPNGAGGGKPKAIIFFMHGIHGHGGIGEILEDGRLIDKALLSHVLTSDGYAFYAYDQYGHGFSEGTRRLIPLSYETNVKDFQVFIRMILAEQGNDTPVFLVAESYGCTVTLHVARIFQDNPKEAPKNFKGIILTAPAIHADMPPYPVEFFLRYVLAPLWPMWSPPFMPNPVPAEKVLKDPDILARRTHPRVKQMGIDGSANKFRLETASNMVSALEDVRTNVIPGFRLPYCIIHGTDDAGVLISGSEYMWETTTTPDEDRAFKRVEGGFHALFTEKEAEEHAAFMLNWMNKHLAK